jgi:hypothetical protein
MLNSPVNGWHIPAFAVRPAGVPLQVMTAASGRTTSFS